MAENVDKLTVLIIAGLAVCGTISGLIIYSKFLAINDVLHEYITVDGLQRDFLIHLPANYTNNATIPMIIALHGGGGNAWDMEKLTNFEFNKLSDKYGFIVVYPNGIGRHWNDGRNIEEYYAQRENINDVKFISKLIDYMIEKYGVDPDRVYLTGMSNGALMCYRLAYEISYKITAIAPVAGSIPLNIYNNETPRGSISVLMINGMNDPLVPWDGGYIHFGDKKLGQVIGVCETASFWAQVDNCTPVKSKEYLPDTDPNDGTRVWKRVYINNTSSMQVILYGIDGGGHTWPGGFHYLPQCIIGRTSNDINACKVIWSFFSHIRKI